MEHTFTIADLVEKTMAFNLYDTPKLLLGIVIWAVIIRFVLWSWENDF